MSDVINPRTLAYLRAREGGGAVCRKCDAVLSQGEFHRGTTCAECTPHNWSAAFEGYCYCSGCMRIFIGAQ